MTEIEKEFERMGEITKEKFGGRARLLDVLETMQRFASNKLWHHWLASVGKRGREFYGWYLKSAAWQTKRIPTLQSNGWKCVRCPNEANQVHHLTYAHVGDELPEELEPLCDECHQREHGKAKP